MVGSLHLTDENLVHVATLPGQAHFAILDTTYTCRECEYWANQRGERNHLGNLKEARCRKALIYLRNPPPIPHHARACKHFAASPTPPAI